MITVNDQQELGMLLMYAANAPMTRGQIEWLRTLMEDGHYVMAAVPVMVTLDRWGKK